MPLMTEEVNSFDDKNCIFAAVAAQSSSQQNSQARAATMSLTVSLSARKTDLKIRNIWVELGGVCKCKCLCTLGEKKNTSSHMQSLHLIAKFESGLTCFSLLQEDRVLVMAVYPDCMCLSCVVSGDILYSPLWPMFCRRKSGEQQQRVPVSRAAHPRKQRKAENWDAKAKMGNNK